jgi:hypothetical protein
MGLRQLRTFFGLCPDDRAIVAETLCLPLAIRLGFAFAGVPRTRRALDRWAESRAVPVQDPLAVVRSAVRLQSIVNRTTHSGGTCLVRSLTLRGILKRRGLDAQLRIGVRKSAAAMEGHAWLEISGAPINEDPAVTSTYVVFAGASELERWEDLK